MVFDMTNEISDVVGGKEAATMRKDPKEFKCKQSKLGL